MSWSLLLLAPLGNRETGNKRTPPIEVNYEVDDDKLISKITVCMSSLSHVAWGEDDGTGGVGGV